MLLYLGMVATTVGTIMNMLIGRIERAEGISERGELSYIISGLCLVVLGIGLMIGHYWGGEIIAYLDPIIGPMLRYVWEVVGSILSAIYQFLHNAAGVAVLGLQWLFDMIGAQAMRALRLVTGGSNPP